MNRWNSLWRLRIRDPIVALLTQGISPSKVALTVSAGIVLAVFPILGASGILCTIAAWILRLNLPLIHAVAACCFPLKCALLIPFYRAGERAFGLAPIPLSIPLIVEKFFAGLTPFLRDYGMTGVRGIIVWAVCALPLGWLLFILFLRPFRAIATRLTS